MTASGSDDVELRRLVFDVLAVRALGEVAAAFRPAGIPVVPVKGVALARWLYATPSERPYVDVDLLVPRDAFPRATALVRERSWPIKYEAPKMGELVFRVSDVEVELHAEIGRRDLTRLSVDDVLARADEDRTTFDHPIQRIDEIDHFLLLVANVVKDGFTYANAHQPADLDRVLNRLRPRWTELIDVARQARFLTGVANVATWMIEAHGSTVFAEFSRHSRLTDLSSRRLFQVAVRRHWQGTAPKPQRLSSTTGLTGLALATLTPDDYRLRAQGLMRGAWRGLQRKLRRDPG